MNGQTKKTGFARLINAAKYSLSGIRAALRTEEAFRHEMILTALLTAIAFWVGKSATEIVLLICSLLLVLTVEILNTAIERAIDRISYERHELSKESKDMASAAVMFSILIAFVTWTTIILL